MVLMKLLLLLSPGVLPRWNVVGAVAQPPLWPRRFTAKVVEVTSVPGLKNWTYAGWYYYDFETGGNLWQHEKGQMEPQCIEVYPSSEGNDCHTLSTSWNGFHVIVPSKRQCCHWGRDSLNTPVRPDWLVQSNATYIGSTTIGGVLCEGWRALGFNENLYYVTADARRLPCQIFMGGAVTKTGVASTFNWQATFDIDSIELGAVDNSTFQLPEYCDSELLCNYPWGPTALPTEAAFLKDDVIQFV